MIKSLGLVLFGAATAALGQFPTAIKNIIVIVQENRTPDNLFHYLTPVCPIPANTSGLDACTPTVSTGCYDIAPCGISNQSGTVKRVNLTPVPLAGSAAPQHSHWSFEKMCDPDPATQKCRNDGAWRVTAPLGASYAYVENSAVTNYNGTAGHLLDPYLTMAKDYGWANYMFQTNQGPSYAAHQFIFSGTSAPTAADDANSTFIAEDFNTIYESGCLAPKYATNSLLSPAISSPSPDCSTFDGKSVKECPMTNTALIYPTEPVGTFCHTHESMANVLDPHAISWEYYAATAGSLANAPVALKNICEPEFVNPNGDPSSALKCTGKEWAANVDTAALGTNILRDIANCSLPQVSWVTPDDRWSDHAGGNDYDGPSWVAAILNSIGTHETCPSGTKDAGQNFWKDTAIIVTWDDWGGWADHELPRVASSLPCRSNDCRGDYEMGFRVPLIVISAYTPAGLISDETHDFGSILRMIEGVHHLSEGQLGFADKRSTTDLHEFFTLTNPRPYHQIPAQKSATYFLNVSGTAIEPDNDED